MAKASTATCWRTRAKAFTCYDDHMQRDRVEQARLRLLPRLLDCDGRWHGAHLYGYFAAEGKLVFGVELWATSEGDWEAAGDEEFWAILRAPSTDRDQHDQSGRLRRELEDLYHREAWPLDDDKLEEWLELFAPGIRCWVPVRMNRQRGQLTQPLLSPHFDGNLAGLQFRVARGGRRGIWRLRRFLTNLLFIEAGDTTARVSSNCQIFNSCKINNSSLERAGDGARHPWTKIWSIIRSHDWTSSSPIIRCACASENTTSRSTYFDGDVYATDNICTHAYARR